MGTNISKILTSARDATTAGYSERLDLLEKVAQMARSFCRTLDTKEAIESRALLRAILEMPLVGTCTPECCSASYVRAVEIEAKCEALAAWARFDPEASVDLPPYLMLQLTIPQSRRIALEAINLIERSENGRRVHSASLVQAMAHPRWHVVELAARGLGKLGKDGPWQATLALSEAMRHTRWQVRRAAAMALGVLTGGKHVALVQAAKKDRHKAVRYVASKMAGKAFVWP